MAVRRPKSKLDLQSGRVVFHLEMRVMQPCHDGDEAQAQSTARGASASLDPVEALEHMRALLEGNARPSVGHGDRGLLIVVPDRHLDIACTAVTYGIVDEVGDRVEEQIPVPPHQYPARALELDVPTLLLGCRIEQLRHLAGHLVEVDDAEGATGIEGFDPRDS